MKRGGFAPQLQEEILEDEAKEEEEEPDYHLSASGHSFKFKGMAGMFVVTRDGMSVHSTEVVGGPSSDLVQLRCNYNDLDVQNGKWLGAGASGKVFAVKHKPSGVRLALKRINVGEDQQMQHIKRELDALYMDGNDHIINFYGAFFDRGNIMIALELMDGSLLDAIAHMQTIPETVLRGITRQVLHGLFYLHKNRHVVHRDVKPSNLLFARNGSIKITDFGISAALQGTQFHARSFVGTVLYMSPERLAGCDYSYPADIWSLGLTLIQLASGKHPYAKLHDKATFWDVLKCIEDEAPPSLPQDKIFSQSFRTFVSRCLERSPQQRSTVTDLMDHPFVAEISDEDAQAVCKEWFPQVHKKMKVAEREMQAQHQKAMDLAEQLLASAIGS
jgi:mitogen-activated protein kinase kinase 1|uniref:mitogen-activated protein kinase kinase n=1 Tax=Eutreptiella gymnastica TaxID=73025 RepID=A0A7S4G103_9EUGL|mmetsp:Transcript_66073/g.110270  ORF Transcript_66073/g.110270 Transcript_66073/m.110270 type:complete len:388 (+) Transcript_66073:57-1220(+)|eukprot:CAMPEP_0174286078 /NCGR_PEP_ID=MMETSP0809-20121228/10611_1 /TAXON_ID=73025 ORGANISM="Eutreptiella gymnastica-like, Strain CCMP1594" /NCGR_SAMPLE_ID=MMETSP0809 /ASSEMBLY_ACC=CAM_ASM_000658 /LENGTH=387 /DNA_ID=CAMNT_0015382013 /DNA_START=57 /DNA_END=1220 /DNA_ORIENTATION=+